MGTYFKPGAHNQICERTGFKIKSTQTRKEWTNRIVRKSSWEARHPQDLLRTKADRQNVRDPRPESEDTFLATNEVTVDSL